MIHPNAIVHPNAKVHKTVEIGPFTVIDEHVTIGAGCIIGPQAHITGHTLIGKENRFPLVPAASKKEPIEAA